MIVLKSGFYLFIYLFIYCHTLIIFTITYTCVWIYENSAKELKSRSKRRAFFFSRQKVDDIKMKRKFSPFFFPLPVYLPFIALLSLFFARFLGLKN